MTLKELKTGMIFKDINGTIDGAKSIVNSKWYKLELTNTDIEILSPKKKIGDSGAYVWVKLFNDFEFLIPWSDLKPIL